MHVRIQALVEETDEDHKKYQHGQKPGSYSNKVPPEYKCWNMKREKKIPKQSK
jgi:hypothetical protein